DRVALPYYVRRERPALRAKARKARTASHEPRAPNGARGRADRHSHPPSSATPSVRTAEPAPSAVTPASEGPGGRPSSLLASKEPASDEAASGTATAASEVAASRATASREPASDMPAQSGSGAGQPGMQLPSAAQSRTQSGSEGQARSQTPLS